MRGKFLTDCGRVRPHNEDSGGVYRNKSGQLLAIIADGMGGHLAGDVASQMATSMLEKEWKQLEEVHTPEQVETWLAENIANINKKIYDLSLEKDECKGMGTTIVIVVCLQDFLTIAHIGDSRCYLYDKHGLKQVTEDHSLVNELVRSGELTKEDAMYHPRKNVVLRALGTQERVKPDIKTLTWEENDRLLLCSDGLTDKVRDEELVPIIQQTESMETIGNELIRLANERGGEDNVSLVIVDYTSDKGEGDISC
ncbi:Stp1/IreP family PP2C-type Ser/Thr phosphatase [Virgibacillus soli]|uniref:Stp1/IreP family PP2C-type Ser/Thr phosphatase n=1 Tax=Paracerasibacillus soli TaxID=480284 RepID=UPI0035E60842